MELWWFPQADKQGTSEVTLIEDDGMSTDYLTGQGVLRTSVVVDRESKCTRWNITHRGSAFVGMPEHRRVALRVVDAIDLLPNLLPSSVTLDGRLQPASVSKRVTGDRYAWNSLVITLPALGYMQNFNVLACS
jgi:hypothetical protein